MYRNVSLRSLSGNTHPDHDDAVERITGVRGQNNPPGTTFKVSTGCRFAVIVILRASEKWRVPAAWQETCQSKNL